MLSSAIETIVDGFVFFDRDDRLVVCNDRFREIHALSAPVIVPGAKYEDILRYGLDHGQYMNAIGREEEWLAERLAARLKPQFVTEQQLADGRWLRLIERTMPGGGRVCLCIDITDLKRQERRLASIISGTNVGTWEWNIQTGELQINERWAGMLGHDLTELAPVTIETFRQRCHPEDLAEADRQMARHLAGKSSFYEVEVRLRHASGRWVWVLSAARVATWSADGRPEWVSGTHQDITERKRQQLEAIAARNHLEATLRAIPDLLIELDLEGRILDYRTGNPEMLTAASDTFIGRTIDEVLPPEVAAVQRAAVREASERGHSTGRQYRLRLHDRDHWFELSVARRPVADDAAPTFIVLARDITAHKALESSLVAERDFFDQIMATNLSAIVVIDAAGDLVFANKAAEQILGVPAGTAMGRRFDDPSWGIATVEGEPFPTDQLPFVQVMTTGEPVVDVRHTIVWPDGTRRVVSVNAALLVANAGATRRVVCSLADITDKIAAESALEYNAALLRGLFELCPVGIALNDFGRGAFVDVNDALLTPTGYSREELMALTIWDLTPEAAWRQEVLHLAALAQSGRYGPFEKEYVRKDGSRYPVLVRGMLVTDLAGRKFTWSIVEDITERKKSEAQILRQALYDELTGLPNRRLFQERLGGALERARRGRHIGAVAMLDLDNFKSVNDIFGHKAGDAVLVEAAARLTGCTRATDTVARFGGDEFLVLLDDLVSADVADTVARKMRWALAHHFTVDERQVQIGVSIGVALFPRDSSDPDELLRFADIAMYKAKRSGRDQIRFHDAT